MLADGECDALGAWPASAARDQLLREHLRERGLDRIDALIGDEGLACVMDVPVARLPLKASAIEALAAAARMHAKIVRAVSRGAPFADVESAVECIALVLEKAELSELAQQRRRLQDHWRAESSPSLAPAGQMPRG